MAEIEIEPYTTDELIGQLGALELHFLQYEDYPTFCADCILKHLLTIRTLCGECEVAGCSGNIWSEIKKFVQEIRDNIKNLTPEKIKEYLKQCREFRKRLEVKALFGMNEKEPYLR